MEQKNNELLEANATELAQKLNELEEKYRKLNEDYLALNETVESAVEERVRERISEKDRYIAAYEQDCDDKVANLNVIITGLRGDLERANRKLAEASKPKCLFKIFSKK